MPDILFTEKRWTSFQPKYVTSDIRWFHEQVLPIKQDPLKINRVYRVMIFDMRLPLVETRREAIIAKWSNVCCSSELPHVIVDTDRLISDQSFDGKFVCRSRPFQRGNLVLRQSCHMSGHHVIFNDCTLKLLWPFVDLALPLNEALWDISSV